ncbi:MAG TPA: PSD1 and planctomycete cytochrome C domain-containing protein [Saprospiraceae bacterium]|nr:PSD1 and planctomycete cytochrome C domain-containing protein [Saprospiraceae bacterium]HMQ82265.1 PSD1 and planctomycete cytochrome C domain-containing protein [Saprospiraceae bacterium]
MKNQISFLKSKRLGTFAPSFLLLLFWGLGLMMVGCQNSANKQDQPGVLTSTPIVPEQVDFNFHVKPILSDRCFKCHGPDEKTREAGLRLDTEEGAFAALGEKQDHYAIIAGDVANSTLIHRIYTDDPNEIMPPLESNLVLEPYEKEILKKWIAQGAVWKKHWAFIPPKKPAIPQVENKAWVKNEIDAFVLARLEQEGLSPNPAASKEKLIRRLSFDLTGLPPQWEQVQAFLQDDSPNAYEKVVDEMLQSDAYAEHMTGRWLDIARYADTHGYQDDLERIMWPWRDWVIHAFQQNMPYDQFIRWQLAGDMLPQATKEQMIATGFNRNHKITQEGGVIPEEYRVEYVADRTQTFATAFLGLTMECARCHDHKYDPISQKEYFQLFSFFNNVPEKGLIEKYGDFPEPILMLSKKDIEAQLTFIKNLDSLETIPLMVMQEMETPRQAFILNRGLYDQPTEPVLPETPENLGLLSNEWPKNRLGLAEWLLSPQHPLMARVTVNRFWQQLFGTGIVATPEDFGSQGALPTHPELLDWLTLKFMEDNWDVKQFLKYIVLSATYQQSTQTNPELLERDPQNLLLARAPRLRLSAETIRDHALAISGLMSGQVGGPSVKPYQPEGIWEETTGGGGGSTSVYVQDSGEDLYRRSLYTFWKRTVPPPSMMAFDAPTRDFCVVKRQRTSTPLQALVLLNDPQIIEACRVLAYRSVETNETDQDRQIEFMFQLATSRSPDHQEKQTLLELLQQEAARFESNQEEAKAFLAIGQYPQKNLLPDAEMAALVVVANAIFNLDETISRG